VREEPSAAPDELAPPREDEGARGEVGHDEEGHHDNVRRVLAPRRVTGETGAPARAPLA